MENLEAYQGADMSADEKSFMLGASESIERIFLFLVVSVLSGSTFGNGIFDNG